MAIFPFQGIVDQIHNLNWRRLVNLVIIIKLQLFRSANKVNIFCRQVASEYTIAAGDVIRSARFVFGMKPCYFESVVPFGEIEITVGFDQSVRLHSEEDRLGLDATDISRAEALFVVEHVSSTCGPDFTPGGRYVKARRLKADGSSDPHGEMITFCMNGCLSPSIEEVELVRSHQHYNQESTYAAL